MPRWNSQQVEFLTTENARMQRELESLHESLPVDDPFPWITDQVKIRIISRNLTVEDLHLVLDPREWTSPDNTLPNDDLTLGPTLDSWRNRPLPLRVDRIARLFPDVKILRQSLSTCRSVLQHHEIKSISLYVMGDYLDSLESYLDQLVKKHRPYRAILFYLVRQLDKISFASKGSAAIDQAVWIVSHRQYKEYISGSMPRVQGGTEQDGEMAATYSGNQLASLSGTAFVNAVAGPSSVFNPPVADDPGIGFSANSDSIPTSDWFDEQGNTEVSSQSGVANPQLYSSPESFINRSGVPMTGFDTNIGNAHAWPSFSEQYFFPTGPMPFTNFQFPPLGFQLVGQTIGKLPEVPVDQGSSHYETPLGTMANVGGSSGPSASTAPGSSGQIALEEDMFNADHSSSISRST